MGPAEDGNIDGAHEVHALLIIAGGSAGRGDKCQQQRISGKDRCAGGGLEAPRLAHKQEGNEVSDCDGLQSAAQFNEVRMIQIYGFPD